MVAFFACPPRRLWSPGGQENGIDPAGSYRRGVYRRTAHKDFVCGSEYRPINILASTPDSRILNRTKHDTMDYEWYSQKVGSRQ